MINPPCQFSYNPKMIVIVMCGGLFGAAAALFFHQATHVDAGIIIDHAIPLDENGARIFFWSLFGGSVMFVVLAAFLLWRKLFSSRLLTLGEQHLDLPHGILQLKTKRIPYAQVRRIWEKTVSKSKFLYLETADGKYSIIQSLLPSNQDFEEIKDFLISRAPQAR